jgi:hypothetical protein
MQDLLGIDADSRARSGEPVPVNGQMQAGQRR